jgi:trehalose-phosphatase
LILCNEKKTEYLLAETEKFWLFLDYDGTLAEFAATPDIIKQDSKLIDLVRRLADNPKCRLAIISGRRLGHIQRLMPVSGIWLAGTYGIEIRLPDSSEIDRLDYASIRPFLDKLKPKWEKIIAEREGFYLEDKGWTLAIHARYVKQNQSEQVISRARAEAMEVSDNPGLHLMGGEKFLEISPVGADKGEAVDYILGQDPFPGSLPVYIGDDDKDERAFEAIKRHQGVAIVVASEPRPSVAECRIRTISSVRSWLENLAGENGLRMAAE